MVLSSTARSLHGRGRGRRRTTATGLAVDQPRQRDDEVGGTVEGGGVDAVGDVVVRVVPGCEVSVRVRSSEGDGTQPPKAGRESIVEEGVADRHRATVRRAGPRQRFAELDQLAVVRDADHGALAHLVRDLAGGDRVDVEEVGTLAVEVLAAGADEG